MTNTNNLTNNERERLAILYCAALERGDFETVGEILERAGADSELERMILGISEESLNKNEQAEIEAIILNSSKIRVRELAESHISSGVPEFEEEQLSLPPLTVRTVLARLQEDVNVKNTIRREVADAQRELRTGDVDLPSDLSFGNVEKMLRSLGLRLSETAQKFVRRTAIFMSMAREENETRLAATRRQRAVGSKKPKAEKTGG